MSQPPTPDAILQTGLAFWPAKTLLSAVELGVFTELAARPPRRSNALADAARPASALGARLLRHAGRARLPDPRRTTATPTRAETDLFLDRAQAVLRRRHPRDGEPPPLPLLGSTSPRRCKTGQPQNEVKTRRARPLRGALRRPGAAEAVPRGDDRHQPRRQHGDRAASSRGATTGPSSTSARRRAISPSQIALANPHLTGTASTCRRSGPIFEEYVAGLGLPDRLTFAPGNFFTDPLPKADVVLMGHILHDWDLPRRRC